jgi:hypothetical protein
VEGVFTSFASVSSVDDPIYFSASTTCTENRPVFPTRFFKEKSRPVFRLSNKFKGFELHRHHILS